MKRWRLALHHRLTAPAKYSSRITGQKVDNVTNHGRRCEGAEEVMTFPQST